MKRWLHYAVVVVHLARIDKHSLDERTRNLEEENRGLRLENKMLHKMENGVSAARPGSKRMGSSENPSIVSLKYAEAEFNGLNFVSR